MRSSGRCSGKKEVAKLLRQEIAELNNPTSIYMLVQHVITVNGDTAKGHWIMDYFSQDLSMPSEPVPIYIPGRYDCEYVRLKGEWKFSSLKWTCPWPVHPVRS